MSFVSKINQLCPNDKIIRFLDLNGLLKTLGINQPNPTFLLGSSQYYKSIENSSWDKNIFDKHENEVYRTLKIEDRTIQCVSGNANPLFISSWSTIDHQAIMKSDNLPFANSDFAIGSTVKKVGMIIDDIVNILNKIKHSNPKMRHGTICYYPENNNIEEFDDSPESTYWYCFYKTIIHANQKEYRFAIHLNPLSNYNWPLLCKEHNFVIGQEKNGFPDILITPVTIADYIDAIYINKNTIIPMDIKEIIIKKCKELNIPIFEY